MLKNNKINLNQEKNNNQQQEVISIIIPCYNYGKYLSETIESIVAQTYKNWEVLIVDDGSTDDSLLISEAIQKKFSDLPISIITQPNGGLVRARNEGAKRTNGKYLLFLDADDKIAPNYLSVAVEILESDLMIAFVYTDVEYFGDRTEIWTSYEFNTNDPYFLNIAFPPALIRRDAFNETGGYNNSMKNGYEEWDLWLSLIDKGFRGHYLPQVMLYYRKHGVSLINDVLSHDIDLRWQLVKNHFRQYPPHFRKWCLNYEKYKNGDNEIQLNLDLLNFYLQQPIWASDYKYWWQEAEKHIDNVVELTKHFTECVNINDRQDLINALFIIKATLGKRSDVKRLFEEYGKEFQNANSNEIVSNVLNNVGLNVNNIFMKLNYPDPSRILQKKKTLSLENNNTILNAKPVIGIDIRTFYISGSISRGIGHYSLYHLKNIIALRPDWKFILYKDADGVPSILDNIIDHQNVDIKDIDDFRESDVDIIHVCDPMNLEPGYDSPARIFGRSKLKTLTFYDLTPMRLYFADWSDNMKNAYTRRIYQYINSDFNFLTISKFTKEDLINAFPIDEERVIPIMAGLNTILKKYVFEDSAIKLIKDKFNIDSPFFLHVGALDPHKNFGAIVTAFMYCQKTMKCQLVVVGKMDNYIKFYAEAVKKNHQIKNVIFTDFISREELEILYHEAIALLFISKYEGFGLPVLEAMANGCPVISSNTTSLPEVAGDAALLFDPNNISGIANGMHDLLSNPEKRDLLRTKGFQQSKKFTWKETAQKTIDVWEKMLDIYIGHNEYKNPQAKMPDDKEHLKIKHIKDSYESKNKQLPVIWLAPFFNPSGYASEAISFVLGLDKYINLTIRHQTNFFSNEFIKNLPEPWKVKLLSLHKIEPEKWKENINLNNDSIIVQHVPANGLSKVKGVKYCIGRTMYETDRIPSSWVDKCNQMDEIWVPSKFNLSTFSKSGVDKNKLVVIPESIDTDVFDPNKVDILELPNRAKFNFLSIFEWTNRKGWDILLDAYFRSFSKEDDVCLYLRTYLVGNYDVDRKKIIQDKIDLFINDSGYIKKELPRIELLTKQLPFNDMLGLYKSVDAFVLPSRGEGWGRPYMEAMSMGLPVIGTNWSGNTEFMTNENSYLIDIEGLIEINENEIKSYIGHKWAQPSEKHLIKILSQIYQNPKEAKKKGIKARRDIVKNFNLDSVAKIIVDRLNKVDEKIKSDKQNKISSTKRISNSDVSIIWEGAQFVNNSLALVNRELCASIVKANFKLSLIKTEADQFKPFPENSYYNLLGKERVNNENPDLHVRHQWPPNLKAPEQGHWVVIQPWEFGSLPQDWVKVFSKSVDEIWVPSNYVRQVYIDSGVPGDRVFVVPNGFDPKVFNLNVKPYSLPSTKKFKFLFVGGTIYRKGIDLLLKAYCEVFKDSDDVSLVIKDMGGNSFYKGQNFKDVIFELKSKKGTPEIIYIDKELNEEEIAGLYTACDVLVHPFRGEGFGLPILEAMASGVPAIVTAGGSAVDFCNSKNSLLINSKKEYIKEKRIGEYKTVDYPWILQPSLDDLKEKILFAYKNQDAMKVLGRKAFASVSQKWTWENAFKILQNRILEISSKPILRDKDNNVNELDADKQLEIAEKYISENKLNDARLILKSILEVKQDNIDALNNLSVVEILESNFEAALKLIEKITDQDPANKIAKSNLEYIETELCKTNAVK